MPAPSMPDVYKRQTYPAVELVRISIAEIQPSQFYVDEIKKRAVSEFVYTEEDLVIPLVKWEGRNVSVDGHTPVSYTHLDVYKRQAVSSSPGMSSPSRWMAVSLTGK